MFLVVFLVVLTTVVLLCSVSLARTGSTLAL